MKASEMRQLLAERGIQLTKSLGQNFLHDRNVLRKIVQAAQLTAADKVLEIGPGLGPLTERILEYAGEVLAIEKDARLVAVLQARFAETMAASGPGEGPSLTAPRLRLLHDDALDFLRREPRDWAGWKLVSNLPFSVASPLLVELAQGRPGPACIVATLQLEVARKLMAQPGDHDYGLLTLLIRLDYEPAGYFKIPASCFFPEPDVDSGCVRLLRRAQPLLEPAARAAFTALVKQAFGQRRKMMFKVLKTHWPAARLERAFAAADLPLQARAETLSLEQFVRLARLLAAESSP